MYGITLLKVIVVAQSHGLATPPVQAPPAPAVVPAVSAPVQAPVVQAPAPAPAPAPVGDPAPTTTTTVPSVTETVTNYVVVLTWSEAGQPDLSTTVGETAANAQTQYNYFLPLIGTSPPSAPTGYVLSAVSAPAAVTNSVTTAP